MRIGLLLCDFVPDEFLPIAGEYIDMFSAMFEGRDVTLVPYEVYRGRLPEDTAECDGYVISGSRSAVYDDEQWIRELETLIREAVDTSAPMFGVCFGLHAMAKALGGTVEEFDGGWGGGVQTMTATDRRPWMTDCSDEISLIMSHQDQVVALPEGARRIGSSGHCENYLVEFAPRHVGIQGHPEFRPTFAEAVYRSYRDTRGSLADDALASLDRPTDTPIVVDWILNVLESS